MTGMIQRAPLRIYGWLDSPLSIARHYGGCVYAGHRYIVAYNEEGQPLVRADIVKLERKESRKEAQAEKSRLRAQQGVLL